MSPHCPSLIKAARKGCFDCVELLIPREAKLRDKKGMTALMYAVKKGHLDCLKLLITHEVGLQDKEGKSALMYAAENGNFKSVKLLIPHEAKLQDNWGKSALMWAAENGNFKCVELLIPREAKLQDNWGKIALDYAIRNFNINCAKCLYNIKSLFSSIFLPNIPIGSFLDILNKAAKQSGKNYDNSMVKISDKLEKLTSPTLLLEYLNITDIKELESRLINDFPEYKERIPSIINELETEELICPVCLDESVQMYRNCINCTGYACKDCWEKTKECMLCRSELYWKKCLDIELLQKVILYNLDIPG